MSIDWSEFLFIWHFLCCDFQSYSSKAIQNDMTVNPQIIIEEFLLYIVKSLECLSNH